MSPTLDDVSVILGIPVIGKSVSCKKLSNVDVANLLVEALGVTIDKANVALKVAPGQSIKIKWLKQRFGQDRHTCSGSVFVFSFGFVIGCFLCLGCSRIGFFIPAIGYCHKPRVFRWISHTQSGSSTSILQRLREDRDRLEAHDVIWDPYHDKRIEHPFSDVAYYSGCLKYMHIVEPYHPDRVLRQFGRVQIIPSPPLAPVRASRGSTAKQNSIAYKYLGTIWESWENHLLSETARSLLVLHPWDCIPGGIG
ncbi:hypothetical protein ACSBR2_027746 [Camellia fascicularis]